MFTGFLNNLEWHKKCQGVFPYFFGGLILHRSASSVQGTCLNAAPHRCHGAQHQADSFLLFFLKLSPRFVLTLYCKRQKPRLCPGPKVRGGYFCQGWKRTKGEIATRGWLTWIGQFLAFLQIDLICVLLHTNPVFALLLANCSTPTSVAAPPSFPISARPWPR